MGIDLSADIGGSLTSGLQIPRKELIVELAFLGGGHKQVGLFLAAQDQHILDLLEDEQIFLPALTTDDGSWSVINKRQILWLSVRLVDGSLPVEEADEEPMLYERRVDVEVHFANADALHGELLFSPPDGKGRASDHLNQSTRFFRVWTADSLFIVNKEHVLRLIEIERASGSKES